MRKFIGYSEKVSMLNNFKELIIYKLYGHDFFYDFYTFNLTNISDILTKYIKIINVKMQYSLPVSLENKCVITYLKKILECNVIENEYSDEYNIMVLFNKYINNDECIPLNKVITNGYIHENDTSKNIESKILKLENYDGVLVSDLEELCDELFDELVEENFSEKMCIEEKKYSEEEFEKLNDEIAETVIEKLSEDFWDNLPEYADKFFDDSYVLFSHKPTIINKITNINYYIVHKYSYYESNLTKLIVLLISHIVAHMDLKLPELELMYKNV